MNKIKSFTTITITIITLFVLFGWILNIKKLPESTTKKEEIIRMSGIVIPPIGTVTGYINFD